EQFSIATPDAQVVVHGTVFSVHVGAPAHPQTCVRVSEGLVEVRHGAGRVYVEAGQTWGCAGGAEQAAASRAPADLLEGVITPPAAPQGKHSAAGAQGTRRATAAA